LRKDVLVRWTSLKTHSLQVLSAARELFIRRRPSFRWWICQVRPHPVS